MTAHSVADSVDMSSESMTDQQSEQATSADEVAAAAQKLADDATPALLQVLRGNPAPEELAALVAVVTAAASNGGGSDETAGALEFWGDKSQALIGRGHYSFSPRSFVNGDLGLY